MRRPECLKPKDHRQGSLETTDPTIVINNPVLMLEIGSCKEIGAAGRFSKDIPRIFKVTGLITGVHSFGFKRKIVAYFLDPDVD